MRDTRGNSLQKSNAIRGIVFAIEWVALLTDQHTDSRTQTLTDLWHSLSTLFLIYYFLLICNFLQLTTHFSAISSFPDNILISLLPFLISFYFQLFCQLFYLQYFNESFIFISFHSMLSFSFISSPSGKHSFLFSFLIFHNPSLMLFPSFLIVLSLFTLEN